jgi:hypothetical protein
LSWCDGSDDEVSEQEFIEMIEAVASNKTKMKAAFK